MAEPLLVWAVYRYRDADGKWCEVETTPDMRRHLETLDRGLRRREERARKREVLATDLKGKRRNGENEEPLGLTDDELSGAMSRRIAGRRQRDNGGTEWQGPRLPVTNIIGLNAIWSGPPEYQAFCRGRKLGPTEFCLDCERHGSELDLPGLTAKELKGLIRPYRPEDDGLKGGSGEKGRGRIAPQRRR